MNAHDAVPALHVERWGSGPAVIFVHGGAPGGGSAAFAAQRPLEARWTLVLPDRPGHGQTPAAGRTDFEREAPLIADLLEDGAHLVGHSYGGLVAMLAAAQRPDAVYSLTLIEPGAMYLARGDPAVRAMGQAVGQAVREQNPRRRVELFLAAVGNPRPVPDPLPEPMLRFAEDLLTMRQPDETAIPLDRLAGAGLPALLISGGHSPAFEKVCDLLAERLHGERAIIPGYGHVPQHSGEPFNARLEAFLAAAR